MSDDKYTRSGSKPVEHRDPIPPADIVEHLACPADEAVAFAKLDAPEETHRMGGYWFPVADTEGHRKIARQVADIVAIPDGDLVHYPYDETPPEVIGTDEVPGWVSPRNVGATLGTVTDADDEDDERDATENESDVTRVTPGNDPLDDEAGQDVDEGMDIKKLRDAVPDDGEGGR